MFLVIKRKEKYVLILLKFFIFLLGSFAFVFGISCIWLVYNSIADHPRISPAEYSLLRNNRLIRLEVNYKSIQYIIKSIKF